MTNHPTAADLDAMQARCDAATRGPSSTVNRGGLGWDVDPVEAGVRGQFEREEDARLFAHARTDLPAVIALAREAMALLDEASDLLPNRGDVLCLSKTVDAMVLAHYGPGGEQPKGGAA